MSFKSLIPVGRDRGVSRPATNPFSALQQEIDRLFEGFSRGFSGFPGRELMPSMDLSETDKEIEITAELPGLEEKDVGIELANGVLAIKGEKRVETEDKDRLFSERYYGRFERRIPVDDIEADKVNASFKSGVLTVTLPKSAKAQEKVKRIAINGH